MEHQETASDGIGERDACDAAAATLPGISTRKALSPDALTAYITRSASHIAALQLVRLPRPNGIQNSID